jgi:HK97 family phage major capsid protein
VTAAEIVSLYYDIPAEYRDNVAWTMSGATEGIIRGLTGNWFNFIPTAAGLGGLAQGTGWMVDPRSRVFNSSSCPAATANLIPIVVGNWSAGYVICENRAMRIARDPYSYASTGQVAIHCSTRFGGTVANPLAFYGLTMATG